MTLQHKDEKKLCQPLTIDSRVVIFFSMSSFDITFVVDRSGSMVSIASDMEGGFRTYLQKLKEVPGEVKLSLVLFDDRYEEVYTGKSLETAPNLVIHPRGNTALLDAVGRTIASTGARLRALPESRRPDKVVVVIITDGQENWSKEFTREQVFEMTTHQQEKYNWEFIYLGANQDAFAVAKDYGLNHGVTFSATPIGADMTFSLAAASTNNARSTGQTIGSTYTQAAYNAAVNAGPANLGIQAAPTAPGIGNGPTSKTP